MHPDKFPNVLRSHLSIPAFGDRHSHPSEPRTRALYDVSFRHEAPGLLCPARVGGFPVTPRTHGPNGPMAHVTFLLGFDFCCQGRAECETRRVHVCHMALFAGATALPTTLMPVMTYATLGNGCTRFMRNWYAIFGTASSTLGVDNAEFRRNKGKKEGCSSGSPQSTPGSRAKEKQFWSVFR